MPNYHIFHSVQIDINTTPQSSRYAITQDIRSRYHTTLNKSGTYSINMGEF